MKDVFYIEGWNASARGEPMNANPCRLGGHSWMWLMGWIAERRANQWTEAEREEFKAKWNARVKENDRWRRGANRYKVEWTQEGLAQVAHLYHSGMKDIDIAFWLGIYWWDVLEILIEYYRDRADNFSNLEADVVEWRDALGALCDSPYKYIDTGNAT